MNYFVVLFAIVVIGLSTAAADVAYPRSCRYAAGRCIEECPAGTHGYSTGCSRKTPEPTCDQPNPVQEEAIICDYSACYCNTPTVRDTASNKCVQLADCPKKH